MTRARIQLPIRLTGLAEEAKRCCTGFEQEAASAQSQLAHAAAFQDHAQYVAAVQRAQHFQHLQGAALIACLPGFNCTVKCLRIWAKSSCCTHAAISLDT